MAPKGTALEAAPTVSLAT